jgi:hypothetical protein
MDTSPEVTHIATGSFRKPIVYPCEQGKDGSGCHYIMEVSDDVITVVKEQVDEIEAER